MDSQTLAELPSAQSVSVGSIPWSIQADFSGDGKSTVEGIPTRGNDSDFIGVTGVEQIGSGLLGGMFTIVIAGVKYSGTLVPITDWDAFKSPSLQLSVMGAFTGSGVFQGTMSEFSLSS